ncbi:MAG: hypothetical protein WC389_14955 [Lutibacter sp.]|jgi:hypothetical protein
METQTLKLVKISEDSKSNDMDRILIYDHKKEKHLATVFPDSVVDFKQVIYPHELKKVQMVANDFHLFFNNLPEHICDNYIIKDKLFECTVCGKTKKVIQ